jgi:GNAT superfamily N-acetyltransferase
VTRIRLFQEQDRKALRKLYLESRRRAYRWWQSAFFTREDFDKDTEGERIWVAVSDGVAVGFAAAWERENFLHHLYVAPQHTGKGIGRLLLQTSVADLGRPASLKCLKANQAAIRFYNKNGWIIAAEGVSKGHGEYYLMKLET